VEIIAGITFGSVFGVVDENMAGWEFFTTLAAFGLLVIMFEAGLELDLQPVLERPTIVALMSVMTFLLPFLAGFGFGQFLDLQFFASFLIGVTLSTTSLGLVYPLFDDFGSLDTERGQLILAVTALCAILSVVALAYGITITSDNARMGTIVVTIALLLFFVIVPVFLVDYIGAIIPESTETNPVKFPMFFALGLAGVFEHIDVHAILGAFFAGLIIAQSTERRSGFDIEKNMKPVVDLVTPVFFFYVGMQAAIPQVTLYNMLMPGGVLAIGIGSEIFGAIAGGITLGARKPDDRATGLGDARSARDVRRRRRARTEPPGRPAEPLQLPDRASGQFGVPLLDDVPVLLRQAAPEAQPHGGEQPNRDRLADATVSGSIAGTRSFSGIAAQVGS
jgi:Kef-type K+ transport system membrane component KefB